MKKRYYILTAIVSYLVFTLGNVPAAKIISLIDKNTQMPAKLYGIQGSLWNGSADRLIMQGQPPVDNLQWSLHPASLLLAQISSEVKAQIKGQNIIGDVSVSATGTLQASDVRARIKADVMQELIQLPLGELGGIFIINIESLNLQPEGLPEVIAELNWKQASLTLAETVDLGNVLLTVEPKDDKQLLAKVSNKKGQILIDGNITVDEKKMYTLDIRFTPEKSATKNILQSLKMFARRQTDGSYQLKRKGNLQEFGI